MLNDDKYTKRTYFFINDDRSMLSAVSYDAEYTIIVKDSQGADRQISFRVPHLSFLCKKHSEMICKRRTRSGIST